MPSVDTIATRTTTDAVYEALYNDIASLKLLPGTRISEAEIASRMGISRQPVRDAFNRLANLGFLLIRPQRATEVRGFSMDDISNARFVRLAIELEVVTRACASWTPDHAKALQDSIAQQHSAISSGQIDAFHALDYDFHKMICTFSGHPLAFQTIQSCKRSVDRLCVLSLRRANEADAVIDDHEEIAAALTSAAPDRARAATEKHLSRLDNTIREIHETHASYFE